MVVRSAVGALCAVAVLGAVAVALPQHNASKSAADKKDPPFGELTKVAFTPATSPDGQAGSAAQDEKSKLIKLASLPVADRMRSPDIQVAPQPAAQNADATPSQPSANQAITPAIPVLTGDSATASADKASEMIVASAEPQAEADQTNVEGDTAPKAAPVPTFHAKPRSGAIDINRASEDELDHLPGGGRIGHSIIKHRPYKTVVDLVHKRVLRLGAFQRIQSAIRAD